MYIPQIMHIKATNITVATISWKYDVARFGPKGSRVNSYTPEKVINAVYAFVVLPRGAWWNPWVRSMIPKILVYENLSYEAFQLR